MFQPSVCAEGVGAEGGEVGGVFGYERAWEDPFPFVVGRANSEGEGGVRLDLGLGWKVACGWWLWKWR